jgi:hypothetical protein
VLGIGAVGETFGIALPMGEVALAGAKRRQTPQGSGKAFEIGGGPIEMRGCAIQPDTGVAFRETGKQRIEEIVQGALISSRVSSGLPASGLALAGS